MYCPQCATQNSDTTKFCRSCGANLSLVPQALSGQLPAAATVERGKRHGHHRREPDGLAGGISQAFIGLAFLIIALGLWLSRMWWGLWMLIPAFALLGKGIGMIVSAKYGNTLAGGAPPQQQQAMPTAAPSSHLPPRNSQSLQPPSVTEGTTRHLDAPVEAHRENR